MEYVTALDIWMVMSLAFIIVAMLETVLVTWMYQKADQNEEAVSYLHVDEDKSFSFPFMQIQFVRRLFLKVLIYGGYLMCFFFSFLFFFYKF